MKPFDLEAAKRGDPILYGCDPREGHFEPAEFLYYDEKTNTCLMRVPYSPYPILYSDRSFFYMAPKKRTVWVNLYHEGAWTEHRTQEDAEKYGQLEHQLGGKAYRLEIEE